eukprot:TRINITY_DN8283_c0_g1_i2.p1 TRINITY_DN8283_c0_g1~~TRINITY_DN8283_c0_g1_i2.p1  ORF type:complete len:359 (-),score=39.23 TRINITY_DN8283_c0_g1_i2:153-1229(-)
MPFQNNLNFHTLKKDERIRSSSIVKETDRVRYAVADAAVASHVVGLSEFSKLVTTRDNPIGAELLDWASKSWQADLANASIWPSFQEDGTKKWDTGLTNPHVYVLSLAHDIQRRYDFLSRYAQIGWNVKAVQWAPGVDGRLVPDHLCNPNGKNATGAESVFLNNAGVFGCFLSHLLIFRQHLRMCPECDLIVLEDDVGFHHDFKKLWQAMMANLPELLESMGPGSKKVPLARIHFGGDAFWAPPISANPTDGYFQPSWVSRTWGYAIKANAVSLILRELQAANGTVDMGIDQRLSGENFVDAFPVVTPIAPLAIACEASSHTDGSSNSDGEDFGTNCEPSKFEHPCWYGTWTGEEFCI